MSVLNIKDMSRTDWLKLRKTGIGGSDAGAVCGVNPYRSAFSVYNDKISEDISDDDNEAMRQGRDLEDYVAERFCEVTGLKVKRSAFMYRSDKHPFMTADIDRFITGEKAGLECKTASAYSADKWKDGAIPESYEIQCRHYMAVMDWDHMYIACLILGKDFVIRKIERDPDMEEAVIKIEEDFWKNHVIPRVMPEPDGSPAYDEILDKYFQRNNDIRSLRLQGFDDDLKRRDELGALILKLETERNEIDQRIKLGMEGNEQAITKDYRISWTFTETTRLDTKKLKAEEPELYKRYAKTTTGRRFAVRRAA